jgi:hypothetical protein
LRRRHRGDPTPDPSEEVSHLGILIGAGLLGVAGNWLAAIIRTRAGRTLGSPALIAGWQSCEG